MADVFKGENMNLEIIKREEILEFAKDNFGTSPEYLWEKFPGYAVLRHKENSKWYGIIMKVTKSALGMRGKEEVDILDVKCEPLMVGSLLKNKGYLPAYHMNKEHWITILLDGSFSRDEVFDLLSLSFHLTSKK